MRLVYDTPHITTARTMYIHIKRDRVSWRYQFYGFC